MASITAANKDFFEFVKSIGESKSKQEEDQIISDEVGYLKKKLLEQNIPKKKMKEILARAIYIEMLGQDASFCYIKSVELCASTSISQKRIGYLTASLFLSPEHEFRFMLVNQIQRDMNSTNLLEVCAALSAVCKLVTVDMIPAVSGDVIKLLGHDQELVRKRCVLALHRLYQMDKSCLLEHGEKIKRMLCDKDPSVMGASLVILYYFIIDDPATYKDLVPSFVSILKQIIEHRLPREYDYHRIPAPWIQMQLLKILAVLGKGDQASSEGIYEVLVEVMRRADVGINVGYAIVYEAVRTVTTIYPNPILLDAAATSISRFIRSDSHNLKYIGIKGLAAIVKDHPRYAADHQMAVIDCLEDPDETLKRKTLDLLLKMTNSVNVEFIVSKLLSFLASTTDDHFRGELVGRITQCAERYAPSNTWYVETMVRVFEVAGEKVKLSVAQTLMQLIAEGAENEEDEEDQDNEHGLSRDDEVRLNAVENFLILLEKPTIPDVLAQTVSWVLGEYGYLSQVFTKEEVMERLRVLALNSNDPVTKAHIITALMKLCAQAGGCPTKVNVFISQYSQSISLDVQQRCLEFKALIAMPDIMVDALPVDASCEDIDVDEKLSFLDSYVQQALANGAIPYSPPVHQGDDDDDGTLNASNVLKFAAYERAVAPLTPTPAATLSGGPTIDLSTMTSMLASPPPVIQALVPTTGNQLLNTKAAGPWGKKPEPSPIPLAPAVIVSPVSSFSTTPSVSSTAIVTGYVAPSITESKPRELSEKEKMAAALFGGVGGKTSNTSRRKSTTPAQNTRVSPVPHSIDKGLLDLQETLPPPPHLVSAPSSSSQGQDQAQAVFDILNEGLSAAVQPLPPMNVDVLQPMPASVPLVPNTQPVSLSTTSTNNISDIFSNISLISPTTAASPFMGMEHDNPGNFLALKMTTQEFGGRWGTLGHEMKQSISCRLKSLSDVQREMPSFIGHVESISATNEAIFAAGEGIGGMVLLHVKLFTFRMSADITVRSSSRETANKLLASICGILK